MPGLTSTGFEGMTLDEIREVVVDYLRATAAFGPEADTSPDSALGQLIGIIAKTIFDLWSAMEAIYDSFTPDASEGQALENLCQVVGVRRLSATAARGYIRPTGVDGTVIPVAPSPPTSATVLRKADSGELFNVVAKPAGTAWQIAEDTLNGGTAPGATTLTVNDATGFQIGDTILLEPTVPASREFVTVSNIVGAVFALSSPLAFGHLNGAAVCVPVLVQAQEIGALTVDAGQITEIVYPVAGLTAVTNPLDLTPGTDEETDQALRARRSRALLVAGTCTDQAIQQRVLQTLDPYTGETFLTAAVCNSNRTMDYATPGDPTTQPPKSFWVIVWPSALTADQQKEILETIWATFPAGIECWAGPVGDPNTITGTVTDSEGNSEDLGFSYATEVEYYVRVLVYYDASLAAPVADLTDLVEAAIQATGNALSVGDKVNGTDFCNAITAINGVKGVEFRATPTALPGVAWPVGDCVPPVAVGTGSIAVFDATDPLRTVITLTAV